MATGTRVTVDVRPHSPIYCIGRIPKFGGAPVVFAPSRNDFARILTFRTKDDAWTSCRRLNGGISLAFNFDAPVRLAAPKEPIYVIVTCVDELVESGWCNFGIDLCEWTDGGEDACIVASTMFNCKALRVGTVDRLERLLSGDDDP
jgi:hypothetical protein